MPPRLPGRGWVDPALRRLPFGFAMRLVDKILTAQGFGAGWSIAASGETSVFRLVAGRAPILFDVGGHLGEYTKAFLATFPKGKSFVFEPSASHLERMRRDLGGDPRVQIHPQGLGAEPAKRPLYKDREISGLASLTRRRLD